MDKTLKEKIKTIKEIKQLDFECDNRFFIDPYRINPNDGELWKKAKEKILIYFNAFFEDVKKHNRDAVCELGRHLHEINANKLGYTNRLSDPKGKGFSLRDLLIIYDEAIKIENYIEDMPDILVLAKNVGPDKISDLTTNIIYEELLEFTHEIIRKYSLGIELKRKRKWCFDVKEKRWKRIELEVPIIDNKEILFLPENIVAKKQIFSYAVVYNALVYPFYKVNLAIHNLIRTLKNGEKLPHCKKIMKKYPETKGTVADFKMKYPDEYKKFKNDMLTEYWRQKFI